MYKIIGADGKEYGPITTEILRQWIAEGRANGQTKVQAEDTHDWKTIAEVPELAALLPTASVPVAGSAPAPSPISLAPVARNNSCAVAGLTLGILSLTLGLCCCYGFPFSVPGLICSVIALNQIKSDPLNQQGKGLATAGMILSILSLVVGAILIITAASIGGPDMIRRLRRL